MQKFYRKTIRFCLSAMLVFITAHKTIGGPPQEPKITLHFSSQPLEIVLEALQKQVDIAIVYSDEDIKNSKAVTVSVNKVPLVQALEKILQGQSLTYSLKSKAIVIHKVGSLVTKEKASFKEDTVRSFSIKGKVVDRKGLPIIGASIAIRTTGKFTISDKNGAFNLDNVSKYQKLTFSSIGYDSLEIIVEGDKLLIAEMNERVSELAEVGISVSTGYQEMLRDRTTGSYAKIDNKLLMRSTSGNVLERIRYVTSGLNYDSRNVNPGQYPISIRGISTINSNVAPLLVVDGFPYDESTGSAVINNINPNDILDVTVLKDAAAASIWGARAGNGVIVINTKKGKLNSKPLIQGTANVVIGERPDMEYLRLMGSEDVIEFQKRLFENGFYNAYDDVYAGIDYFPVIQEVPEILLSQRKGTITQSEAEERINSLKRGNVKDDVKKYLLQELVEQQYAVNFSGGSDKMIYYSSVGYNGSVGPNEQSKNNRISFRFDNTFKAAKNLEINSFLNYIINEQSFSDISYSNYIPDGNNNIAPYTRLVDGKGKAIPIPMKYRLPFVDTASYPGLLDWRFVPLNEIDNSKTRSKSYDARVGGGAKYQILKSLSAEVKFQYQKINSNRRNYWNDESFYAADLINSYTSIDALTGIVKRPVPIGGVMNIGNSTQSNWNVRGQLNFIKSWDENSLLAIGGFETSENKFESYTDRWYGYNATTSTYSPNIDFVNRYRLRGFLGRSLQIPTGNSYGGRTTRLRSYYLNVNYSLLSKYNLSLSGRQDGANLFGVLRNQKVAPFWSTGFKWDISKEGFYNLDLLPSLNFRISYGFNGNMKNDATVFPTMLYSSIPDNRTNYIWSQIVTPPNPSLSWEKVSILNLGVDFQFIRECISGTIEYYKRKGVDLISKDFLDPTTGWLSFTGNSASNKGEGLDITINTKNLNRSIYWGTAFLFSYNVDKVTSYKLIPTATSVFSGGPIVGKPLNGVYSYKWGGLDAMNGDPKGFVGDTIVDYNTVLMGNNTKPEDLIYHGTSRPKYFGSVMNSFSYKDFAFSFNINYQLGYFFRRSSINYTNLINNGGGHIDYKLRWTKSGDESKTFVPSIPGGVNDVRDLFYARSEVLVERADHIRLQDVRLSYSFNILRYGVPIGIEVFGYATNLGLLWKANDVGVDPGYMGIPPGKQYSVGLSVRY
ncbi:MAG: SusC/RagA family TonB-linked outer membrane protein [Candidatus Pseudobacter hemicellulosilyticus]|uniref:SusC/RagA family TonB-linked outer membrane protein n=1 Tax=Candidatus Pseudobacter hemicellulosilyticus TaxID=3121375 RepID=A0AAJ6BGF3_9BACT|nr:MAG: SusC/RagA family TonB-linked outer membrane protein [Pseudobacter sp.]